MAKCYLCGVGNKQLTRNKDGIEFCNRCAEEQGLSCDNPIKSPGEKIPVEKSPWAGLDLSKLPNQDWVQPLPFTKEELEKAMKEVEDNKVFEFAEGPVDGEWDTTDIDKLFP